MLPKPVFLLDKKIIIDRIGLKIGTNINKKIIYGP